MRRRGREGEKARPDMRARRRSRKRVRSPLPQRKIKNRRNAQRSGANIASPPPRTTPPPTRPAKWSPKSTRLPRRTRDTRPSMPPRLTTSLPSLPPRATGRGEGLDTTTPIIITATVGSARPPRTLDIITTVTMAPPLLPPPLLGTTTIGTGATPPPPRPRATSEGVAGPPCPPMEGGVEGAGPLVRHPPPRTSSNIGTDIPGPPQAGAEISPPPLPLLGVTPLAPPATDAPGPPTITAIARLARPAGVLAVAAGDIITAPRVVSGGPGDFQGPPTIPPGGTGPALRPPEGNIPDPRPIPPPPPRRDVASTVTPPRLGVGVTTAPPQRWTAARAGERGRSDR